MIESLIRAGAMDSLEGTRAQLFAAVEGAVEAGQRAWRDRECGQGGLFGDAVEETHTEHPLPQAAAWSSREMLMGEKEILGFYVTGHPLDQYQDKIRELATHDTSNLEGLERNTEVTLCGVLAGIQRKRNREQKPWASLQIEDRSGSIDAIVFAASFERLAQYVDEDKVVLVRGLVLPEESGPSKISIQDIVPFGRGARGLARADLHSGVAGPQRRVGQAGRAAGVIPRQARSSAREAAAGNAQGLFGNPGCARHSATRPGVSPGAGEDLRAGLRGSAGGVVGGPEGRRGSSDESRRTSPELPAVAIGQRQPSLSTLRIIDN